MKRRAFLKQMGQVALVTALPITLMASRPKRYSIEDQIRVQLKKDASERMDEIAFEQMHEGAFVRRDGYMSEKLLTGEIGHYEGVRFLPSPMLP